MQLEEVNQPESTAEETSPVEAPEEWQSLDGKSQERFQALANQKKEAERLAESERQERERLARENEQLRLAQTQVKVPMPPRQGEMTSEEEAAYRRLTELGVADQSYVDKKVEEKLKVIEDRLYFDAIHSRLESDINSKKGMPRYNRQEVEAHMREKQIYDPKAAYNDLFHDEVLAYEVGQASSKKTTATQTEGTRSRISTTEPWTRESLAERLRQPDGKEFYIKNKDKILKMAPSLE